MKKLLNILFLALSSVLHAQDGLIAEYYNGTNFEQKVLTRVDSKIDFYWGFEGPQKGVVDDSYYSVRWVGKILAPETGKYLFSAKMDDGIRLWVNDVPLINAWDLHDMGDFSNSINLEANKTYTIKVEYFNAMREGEIKVLWQLPSQVQDAKTFSYKNFKPVPNTYFYQPQTIPQLPKPPVIASKNPIPQKVSTPSSVKPKPTTPSVSKPQTANPVSAFDKMDKNLDVKQVFFIRSINKMTDNSVERLDRVADFLKKNVKAKIELKGHTDVMGDAEKNMELSINRAKGVADYLMSKGISENRILFEGFGGNQPFIALPKTEEERALNRRVEFVIKN
jgi:outer membrane protein OmpA-like peptidoglycan-associated protein